MTPDKARDLLDGTTPGPWRVDPEHSGDVLSPKHHWLASTYETGEGFTADELARAQADAALIAAAPVLAAMRAGMREEWGVRYESPFGGLVAHHEQWMDSENRPLDRYAARRFADGCERSGYENVRIVRRYVTEPEEA